MSITVDFLIGFGYGRRHYNETLDQYRHATLTDKDTMNRIVKYRADLGENAAKVRAELMNENAQAQRDAISHARSVIQILADSFNRIGMTKDEVTKVMKLG